MTVLAILIAFVTLGALAVLFEGGRAIPELADAPPPTSHPRVSIVFAARDEVRAVEGAVRSLLAQDYPALEVVAVDDRSTDGTREVLDRLAGSEPRLRVAHVQELPAGWLGKTHALQRGAESAAGELLLFTDADVVMRADAVSRAVGLLQARGADHVAAGPGLVSPTLPLALVVNFFTMAFLLFQRPWRAMNPRSADHIGIGAFNLVTRDAYERAGGHARVALRPDDDVKLGKAIKLAGGRQLFASGRGLMTIEWYSTLGDMVRGLRKNSFAGMEYSVARFVGAIAALLLVHVLPFVLVWTTEGTARAAWAVTCLALMAAYFATAAAAKSRPWLAILYPVAALLFCWVFVRNVVLTLREGGIEWRGTRYSLEELRRNVV